MLGIGTGESLNEVAPTGIEWPDFKERYARLREAVTLMRKLWSEEFVDYQGAYYRTQGATIYDRPDSGVPLYIAAGGPQMAKYAGRDPDSIDRMIEVKVSYDTDLQRAREDTRLWGALALSAEEKVGVEDPREMERRADALPVERTVTRWIVSTDPDEHVEQIKFYSDLGFNHLVFHAPGNDQKRFIELYAEQVLPRLRKLTPAPLQA